MRPTSLRLRRGRGPLAHVGKRDGMTARQLPRYINHSTDPVSQPKTTLKCSSLAAVAQWQSVRPLETGLGGTHKCEGKFSRISF